LASDELSYAKYRKAVQMAPSIGKAADACVTELFGLLRATKIAPTSGNERS